MFVKGYCASANDTIDHPVLAVFIAANQPSARSEILSDGIERAVVRICDEHLAGAALGCTGDRTIRVDRHPHAPTLVVVTLAGSRRPASGGLTARGYARNASMSTDSKIVTSCSVRQRRRGSSA